MFYLHQVIDLTAAATNHARLVRRRVPPYVLWPSVLVIVLMALPLFYMFLRAFQADWETVQRLVFRPRNLDLMINTLRLMFGVTALCTVIALPLAWLVAKTDLPGRRWVTLLAVMPLAVPGYVMAYALLSVGGFHGVSAQWFDIRLPRIQGYWGATIALALYTFPYLFLNLRAALYGLDANLEESAASLGYSRWQILRSVTLPHLLPALLAGWLVILLYTLGDFGAIALMRYEVFSYAIYTQYSGATDRIYAAWLSLMLLSLALCFVAIEALVVHKKKYARTGSGAARQAPLFRLGLWAIPAWLFVIAVALVSLGLPATILTYWLLLSPPDISFFMDVPVTFLKSASAAIPAAVIAALLAIPVAYLSVRYPSRLSAAVERAAYIGYSIPPLTLGLALVFFALHSAQFLYQTLPLLILGWIMATLALAIGPIRSSLLQTRPNLEESAQSLGHSPLSTFVRVVMPRLRRGVVTGVVLVFVFLMKELPITFMLAPTGYDTLAVTVFTRTSEGMYAEAAPFAAAIVVFSSLTVALMLSNEGKR
ncbi:MAG: iron ABC transporter permease [Natronospirillum sp.]|uniref:ABC transporter permease n=1 Tax=Natronospirillum sp. TaxID=2812955 RepID=UPI0025E24A89|nr:iron ABC transporter permease [Natronospirillum sp.]MCH8552859.1 iron ABC transporter permease [Natronospirillum sp.]